MQISLDRRQLVTGATTFALASAFPRLSHAAGLPWKTDSKVEVSGHNPQVGNGPTVASGGGSVLTVYLGEGGENLWYSFTDQSFIWQGNQHVADKSGNATSDSGRPALAYADGAGYYNLVIPGKQVFYSWRFNSIQSQWSRDPITQDITTLQFREPALAYDGSTMHMLVTQNTGEMAWWSRKNDSSLWGNAKSVASGNWPSMVSAADGTIHAIYWDTDQKAFVKLTLPRGAPTWKSNRILPQGKTPDQGAVIALLGGHLYMVFTAQSHTMQYALLNADNTLGPLPYGTVAPPDGHAAATDAPLSATTFKQSLKQSLIVLHKGESSKNLWFSLTE